MRIEREIGTTECHLFEQQIHSLDLKLKHSVENSNLKLRGEKFQKVVS